MKKKTGIYMLGLTIGIGFPMMVRADDVNSTGKIGFVAGQNITAPVNPDLPNPSNPVQPENPDGSLSNSGSMGNLTIDYASSFDFGIHKISHENQVYHAKAQKFVGNNQRSPDYVQITDNRGTLAGWTLNVLETSQFTETVKNGKYPVLNGAQIALKNAQAISQSTDVSPPNVSRQTDLIPGQISQIAAAAIGSAAGTWIISWGTQADIVKSDTTDVALSVPGNIPKDAASYSTQLIWTLSNLPTNNGNN